MSGDDEIANIDNDVLTAAEKFQGQYWRLGIDTNTMAPVFRQVPQSKPADEEIFLIFDPFEFKGWVWSKSVDLKDCSNARLM